MVALVPIPMPRISQFREPRRARRSSKSLGCVHGPVHHFVGLPIARYVEMTSSMTRSASSSLTRETMTSLCHVPDDEGAMR